MSPGSSSHDGVIRGLIALMTSIAVVIAPMTHGSVGDEPDDDASDDATDEDLRRRARPAVEGARARRPGALTRPRPRLPLLVAQGALSPMVVAGGLGRGCGTTRAAAGSTSPASGQRQHRPPAPQGRGRDPGAGRDPRATGGPRPRRRRSCADEAARPDHRRAPAGLDTVFFHQRRADAVENAIRMARLHTGRDKVVSTYRSYHGNTGAAVVATGDWRRVPNEFAPRARARLRALPLPQRVRGHHARRRAERALQHLRRVVESEGPSGSRRCSSRRCPAPPACWCPPAGLPRGRARAVRPPRDRDDPRRGDGPASGARCECSPSTPRRRARPDHLRQGRQLRLRAGRRRRDRRGGRGLLRRARLPGRADLLRPTRWPLRPSSPRSTPWPRRASSPRPPHRHRRALGPASPRSPSATAWGARCAASASSGPSSSSPTAPPASRCRGEQARAKSELLARGLLPLLADNRIHVVPPCVVTDDEVAEALEAYDAVLTLLDEE